MKAYTDWDIIIIIITGIILFAIFITFIIIFLFTYQRRHHNYLKEKQQLQTTFQQEILRTQLEIQEQTLKNISQEIHDNIGQALTLAKLNISTMNSGDTFKLDEKIMDSKNLLSKAIQDLRDLSKSLHTDYVSEMGLLRSVEYELELLKKTGSCDTHLVTEGSPYRIDPQKELILFRIFQEGLNNILKHAKATTIEVHINFRPGELTLHLHDDGQGFEPDPLGTGSSGLTGLGIRNMQNRAKLIGADFKIRSALKNGTTLQLSVPVQYN